MNSRYHAPMADYILLLWNRFIFSLWYIALPLWTHIDQCIQQSTSTNTWNECKKIEKQLAFTFVFMVCSLQIRKYRWLISKSSIDLLCCMIIASCSHFELTIFNFNPGHLLNSCADIENLNSMQWTRAIIRACILYKKKESWKQPKEKQCMYFYTNT